MQRYSSRRQALDQSFLAQRLHNARGYDRIAGYFSSSLLEVAGEDIESISGKMRVVCNSDLQSLDVNTAIAAKNALWKSITWKEGPQVSGQLDNRFDVIVLVRIDGRPSWAGATLDWDDQTITGSGEANQYRHPSGVIYKFDEPTEPNYIYGYDDGGNLKSRGEYGNSIQVRVLFKYTDNFSVDDWASAFIESITVKYDAPYTVKHHEELEF